MTTKAESALKEWLSKDVLRRAEIKDHTHGIRVTLSVSYKEVASAVEKDFNSAVLSAIKHYEEFGYKIFLEESVAYSSRRHQEALERVHEAERELERDKFKLATYLANKLLCT